MKVAEALRQKVHVDSRKLGSLRCFDWSPQQMAQLTTRPQDTPLRVVPLDHISFATMAEYARSGCKQSSSAASPSKENPPLFDTVIGFRPTGWTHTAAKEDAPSEAKKRKKAKGHMRRLRPPRFLFEWKCSLIVVSDHVLATKLRTSSEHSPN